MVTLFDNGTILNGYTQEIINAAKREGRNEDRIETAKKMLGESLPIDLISRISGLSVPEINAIKSSMPN